MYIYILQKYIHNIIHIHMELILTLGENTAHSWKIFYYLHNL